MFNLRINNRYNTHLKSSVRSIEVYRAQHRQYLTELIYDKKPLQFSQFGFLIIYTLPRARITTRNDKHSSK